MEFVNIYLMGKKYRVPSELTVQKAMEYAGFQIIRGCGCRGGVCGACAMVYRTADDFNIRSGLACVMLVQEGMMILNLPYYPARKATYDLDGLTPTAEAILRFYPEATRCMGCNACTLICPQSLRVMDIMAEILNGGIQQAADLSAECVMCGLCAAKCPAGLAPYHIALLCRRLYGRHMLLPYSHVRRRLDEIDSGKYDDEMDNMVKFNRDQLVEAYQKSMADRQLI